MFRKAGYRFVTRTAQSRKPPKHTRAAARRGMGIPLVGRKAGLVQGRGLPAGVAASPKANESGRAAGRLRAVEDLVIRSLF